jgi:phosphoserine phosphatase RsbU/P
MDTLLATGPVRSPVIPTPQQILASVGHDLSGPLLAIRLAAGLVLSGRHLSEAEVAAMQGLLSETARAGRMIDGLLEYTGVSQAGGATLTRATTDLHALLSRLVEKRRSGAPERAFILSCGGEPQGFWDEQRLGTVFYHLLDNALAYSPPGTPVTISSTGNPGAHVVEVHNQGPPIPPEQLEVLFHPIRPPQRRADRCFKSLGLCLYLVHSLVQAHQGTVQVRSTAAEGTTFTVRLPRA